MHDCHDKNSVQQEGDLFTSNLDLLVITKNKNREPLNITWEEKQLEQVERFEYLETIVTADGKIDEEIHHRVQKANQIYYQLVNTIVGNKELKEDTK